MPTGWSPADMPDQHGRTALVTGANSGIGFHVAAELAGQGAHVLLASRDADRGRAARAAIVRELPTASIELVGLDLADLDSVARLADQILDRPAGLDLLINNAGVMAVPRRLTTAAGFELQFGTNHLGHFALTGRLLPAMAARPGSRVVTVSSLNHRLGSIRLDDLQSEHGYGPWRAYNQSKLANALFTLELDRRLRAAGAETISVGAHPGYSHTSLQYSGPRLGGGASSRGSWGCSPRWPPSLRRKARCRCCGPPPILTPAAATITGPVVSVRAAALPARLLTPGRPAMSSSRAVSGRPPRRSPG